MLHRTVCIASLFLLTTLAARAQAKNPQGQETCRSANCSNFAPSDRGTVYPTRPPENKTGDLNFKAGEGPVSCWVFKYDFSDGSPVVHLLCPGPEIYAPLRVHLALTWTDPGEVPSTIKSMVVETNSRALFKSAPGNARAELSLHPAQQTQSRKEWVKFTKCKVSLVLPTER